MEDLELKKVKFINKIEKINNEIVALSNNSKRELGKDGLGNTYYIFRGKNYNIRIHVKNVHGNWGVYTKYSEFAELIDCLTEKGKKEKELQEKIKCLNHKLVESDSFIIETEEIILNQISTWINLSNKACVSKKESYLNEKPYSAHYNINFIASNFEIIEKAYTLKLAKENKEWDSPLIREEFLTFTKNITDTENFKKCILLLNNSFAKPYIISKQVNFINTKIIEDDENLDEYRCPIIDDYNSPNPNYKEETAEKNERLKNSMSNIKLWKDYSELSMEEYFTELVDNVKTNLDFSYVLLVFAGLVNKWTKEHNYKYDFIKKSDKGSKMEQSENFDFIDEDKESKIKKSKKNFDFNFDEYKYEDKGPRTRRQVNNIFPIPEMKPQKKKNIVSLLFLFLGLE